MWYRQYKHSFISAIFTGIRPAEDRPSQQSVMGERGAYEY